MTEVQRTISPVDDSVYVERPYASPEQIHAVTSKAAAAHQAWKHVSIAERAALCTGFVEAFVAKTDEIAPELSWQMGRPVSAAPSEVRGFDERARYMIEIAHDALADVQARAKPGFTRFIRREPLGVVLTIAAWNYPYLIAVNSVVPAVMAGNAVVLKHSAQTPLCAERFEQCFREAGLPEGVFQVLHMNHASTERAIQDPRINFVAFTGSVGGGHAIQHATSSRFVATGLELGGKDPAYVRPDVDLAHALENLVDGSFFNSGQSCCAIERIYVHEDVYNKFLEGFVELTKQYRLGNPLDPETNLGPLVRASAAEFVRAQTGEAIQAGARPLVDPQLFPANKPGTPYLAPQILVNVDHNMRVMTEETFGPVVGIMKVHSDDEAIALMNDSPYGLTASIWTQDEAAAIAIGEQVDTGTWFMNRCDYLDPALAWVGVKDSGRGCTLSSIG
ncbi:MAG: aldehyde dehydrogenase family protein, partial [Acidiferrobacterales bacterium]